MMVSAAACSICWIMIAMSLGISANGGNEYKLGIVAVSFFFVFFASFGMGVLGIPWLYPVCVTSIVSFDSMLLLGTSLTYGRRRLTP